MTTIRAGCAGVVAWRCRDICVTRHWGLLTFVLGTESHERGTKRDERGVALDQLAIAGRNAPKLLETIEEPPDGIAILVVGSIITPLLEPDAAAWNYCTRLLLSDESHQLIRAVATVGRGIGTGVSSNVCVPAPISSESWTPILPMNINKS